MYGFVARFWDAYPDFPLDASDALEVRLWFVGDRVSLIPPPPKGAELRTGRYPQKA